MPEILEERQAKVEATLEQIDKRLGNVEAAIRDLNAKIDTKTDALTAKIDTNFRWIMGTIITMWVTIILSIVTATCTIILKG